MGSEFIVFTGIEHLLSMPGESFPTGGRPALEVRFNVRLCVAKKYREAAPLGAQSAGCHRLGSYYFASTD